MLVNCGNVNELKIGKMVGEGLQKQTYAGKFRGVKVAVKVLYQGGRVKRCLKERIPEKMCYHYPYLTMLYDIYLNKQLQHTGITKLLGYCVRDVHNPPYKDQPLTKRGVITVFEYGQKFTSKPKYGLLLRLQFSLQLADLLDYLAHSPIGSLQIGDLMGGNFVTVNGRLKLADIEHSYVSEPRCRFGNFTRACKYNLECVDGECVGYNAKEMMRVATARFFRKWLKVIDETDMEYATELEMLSSSLKNSSTTAAQIRSGVKKILDKIPK